MRSSFCTVVVLTTQLILCGCNPPTPGTAAVLRTVTPTTAAISEDQADDHEQAVSVARRYAKAIADGDLSTASTLVSAPTPNHRRLAQSVGRLFNAYHRVRTAASGQIGEAEAKRLPMNDAGTFFIDRMTAHVDGDSATITWNDDFGPAGTSRDLPFVRAGGHWRLSLKMFTSGNGPETVRDVLDAIGETSAFTRELEQVEARIKSGELKTFEAIQRAI